MFHLRRDIVALEGCSGGASATACNGGSNGSDDSYRGSDDNCSGNNRCDSYSGGDNYSGADSAGSHSCREATAVDELLLLTEFKAMLLLLLLLLLLC